MHRLRLQDDEFHPGQGSEMAFIARDQRTIMGAGDSADPQVVLADSAINSGLGVLEVRAHFGVVRDDRFDFRERETEAEETLHLVRIVSGSAGPVPELAENHPRDAENIPGSLRSEPESPVLFPPQSDQESGVGD